VPARHLALPLARRPPQSARAAASSSQAGPRSTSKDPRPKPARYCGQQTSQFLPEKLERAVRYSAVPIAVFLAGFALGNLDIIHEFVEHPSALGITLEGRKDVQGLWTSATEGAKFWMNVLTELRNRGVKDIYLVCLDGLKGFPQAIEAVFPKAQVQLCIVHLVRASLNYVSWQDRKQVVAHLKPIYRAATAGEAVQQLGEFESQWSKYPAIARLWREQWEHVIPFFAFPPEVRKVVYTTNAVESLHMSLRKVIQTRGSFPNEEAAFKLLYLALSRMVAKL
jgi:hypothetical protein